MSLNLSVDSFGIRGFFLPDVGFWAVPESIGVSDAEAVDYFDGAVTPARRVEIELAVEFAVRGLGDVIPAGVADWMPLRKAMS